MTLRISSNFDSGAIEVAVHCLVRRHPPQAACADQGVGGDAAFRQWFHFRLHSAAGQEVRMVFENAAAAAYPDGWPGYRCVAPPTGATGSVSAIPALKTASPIVEHRPERNSIYYAYFRAVFHERHLDLLGRVEMSRLCIGEQPGGTVEGATDLVTVGCPAPGKRPVDHRPPAPGESMAEWFIEGSLERRSTAPTRWPGASARRRCSASSPT